MKVPRIRLSENEHALIKQLRTKGVASELVNQCDEAGLSISNISHFWYKSEKFSIFSKNTGLQLEDIFEPIIKDVQKYSPKIQKIKRTRIKSPHCLILDPSDIHVGKLAVNQESGESYDVRKAVSIVDAGIDALLQKASGFPLDKIIFVIGNDCLHIDSASANVTTGGTNQDMDGRWHDAFIAAKDMYVRAIEKLLPIADVEIIFCPSNHDFMSGFMLAQTVKAYFRKSKNVSFDVSIAHRKYTAYGKNLLSFSHGDGAKLADTPLLMATERPGMWSESVHRYIYLHHIHHKQTAKFMAGQDFIGVTAEYLRSPSASDAWHAKKGYRSPKAVEAFIHSYDNGQVARLTHYVDTEQKVCKCGCNLYHHFTLGWRCERCEG